MANSKETASRITLIFAVNNFAQGWSLYVHLWYVIRVTWFYRGGVEYPVPARSGNGTVMRPMLQLDTTPQSWC